MSRKIDGIGLRCLVIALAFLSIMAATNKAKAAIFSPTGKVNTLVIFTKFAEEAPEDSLAPSWAQDIFNPDFPGSLTHYFQTMSCDVFTVSGSCLKKRYSSDHPASHYTNQNCGEFNLEILQRADQDVDFGEYDNDGPDGIPNSGDDDGYVDFVFVNLRSMPQNFIYGPVTGIGMLNLSQPYVSNDKKVPSGYIQVRHGATLLSKTNLGSTVGYMSHEFGHSLGLDELADLSFVFDPEQPPEEDSAGIGKWGMMSYGGLGWEEGDPPVPLCAHSLERLGWIGENNGRLVVVQESMSDVVIKPLLAGGNVYKIALSNHEYFLVTNRQASACHYDQHIPGSGLLIWHIVWHAKRAHVDLECADGRWDDRGYPDGTVPSPDSGEDNLDFWARDESYRSNHNGNRGDATDVFDGVRFTEFGPNTNPSSKWETKPFASCIAVTNIRREGTNMVANFELPKGVELYDFEIRDRWVWQRDANGVANPGEYIGFSFRFKNWSPQRFPLLRIEVSAEDDYIYPDRQFALDLFAHDVEPGAFFSTDSTAHAQIDSSLLEDLWDIDDYILGEISWPVLIISSSCPEDHRIILSLEVTDEISTWSDTTSFAVTGSDEIPSEIWSVDVAPKVTTAGNPVTIRALIREPGPLASVEAMIFSSPDSVLLASVPLRYEKTASIGTGWRIYRGDWTVTSQSDYWSDVVATDINTNNSSADRISFSRSRLYFSTMPFIKSTNIFLYGRYWLASSDYCYPLLETLDAAEIEYDLWNIFFRGKVDEPTLNFYRNRNAVVIFYAYESEEEMLGNFLSNGGRLLLISELPTFMKNYLYTHQDPHGSWRFGVLKGTPGDPISDGIEQGNMALPVIYPSPPAVPIFTYASTGEAVAVRVDTGGYKAVYLPWHLFRSLEDSPTGVLIMQRAIEWLLSPSTGVEQEETTEPTTLVFRLQQNYPNPFNSATLIRYQLASSGKTRLSIYNLLGQEVVQLVGAVQKPGTYSVLWNGKDKNSRDLASGLYLCKLKSGNLSAVRKLVLLR